MTASSRSAPRRGWLSVPSGLALLGALAGLGRTQCTNPWLTVPGSTGVEGSVSDVLGFDPDGAGPIGERLLVAGWFQIAGTVQTQSSTPAARSPR